MKTFKILALLAFLSCCTLDCNAQSFWKKLGKAAKEIGTAVLDGVVEGSESSESTASSLAETVGLSKVPGFDVKLDACHRMGNTVWIEFLITNNGTEDKRFEYYNHFMERKTSHFIAGGQAYNLPIFIYNGDCLSASSWNYQSATYPAGIPVRLIMLDEVPSKVKTVDEATLCFEADKNVFLKFKNIPIEEVSGNTNKDNLVCEFPHYTVNYMGSTRNGNTVDLKYQIINNLSDDANFSLSKFDKTSNEYIEAYDSNGTLCGKTKVTFSNADTSWNVATALPSGLPVTMTLSIPVSSAAKSFARVSVAFKYYGSTFLIRHKNLAF